MKKVTWKVVNGDIADVDNYPEIIPAEEEQDYFTDALKKHYDQPENRPEDITVYTGDVLYIGQEDDISGRRFIKFVVKDTDGLVWSLLPQQIRYI